MSQQLPLVSCRLILHKFLLCLFLAVGGLGCQNQTDSNIGAVTPMVADATAEIELRDLAFATLAPPTIVVVQQSPTPLPTPTPTPTPTPIVYVIEDGDTLLGVALQNQTTVEDILNMNGDLRPELLSIGQEIVLPPPATPVFAGDRPTAIPISVDIISKQIYPDGAGGLWVMGELQNSTGIAIENLKLEVTLFGPEGTAVAQRTVWVPRKLLPTGQKSPFGVLFPQKPVGQLQADVQLVEGFAVIQPPVSDVPVVVEALNIEPGDGVVTVTGRVSNLGGAQVEINSLLITLFDDEDQVVGFAEIGQLVKSLEPGESQPLAHDFIPPGRNPTRAEAVVEINN